MGSLFKGSYNWKYDDFICVNELGEVDSSRNYVILCIRNLLKKYGISLKQIQNWLKHSNFSTTANIYAHLDYGSKLSSAQAKVNGMALLENVDFVSK